MIQQEHAIFSGPDVLDANASKKKMSYSIFMLSRWGRYGLQFQDYHIPYTVTVFMICGGILFESSTWNGQNKITGQNCNPKLVFGRNSYCNKYWRGNHKRDKTEPRCHIGHKWAQCYPWIIVRRYWVNIWCRSHGFHLFETWSFQTPYKGENWSWGQCSCHMDYGPLSDKIPSCLVLQSWCGVKIELV